MDLTLLFQALAGVGAFVTAVVIGMCMVLCARSHFSQVTERVRQFLRR